MELFLFTSTKVEDGTKKLFINWVCLDLEGPKSHKTWPRALNEQETQTMLRHIQTTGICGRILDLQVSKLELENLQSASCQKGG